MLSRPSAWRTSALRVAAAGALALWGTAPALASPEAAPSPRTASVSAPAASPTDSTDALTWARRVVALRRAIEAAEAEVDPDRQAQHAEAVLSDALALAASSDDDALRPLVLRAQAVYEPHHGAVRTTALTPAEFGALRADALAPMRSGDVEAVLVDPALLAAQRAEAARAAGPAHLFYPTEAAPLVEAQQRAARGFAGLRSRMRQHFPRIERTLRRRGVPTEIKYVAVIESALDPQARSHAGARGLWQFMPATAAEFGLDAQAVADPAASTDAAARYLRQLHRQFEGDWQLALAAYNAGPARVLRLVRAHQTETGAYPSFWDIVDGLPRETQAYVPRFIAVAELLG
ncbi:MAG: lytic transglycosylase domain-containing protein [Bacteroidota bacterium]